VGERQRLVEAIGGAAWHTRRIAQQLPADLTRLHYAYRAASLGWFPHRRAVIHMRSSDMSIHFAIVKGTDLIESTLRALDQFRIGSFGVAACEAMAAGRIVVSHVSEQVRSVVTDATELSVPIVQAEADELAAVLRAVVDDPSEALALTARGADFVTSVHEGSASAAAPVSLMKETA